MSKMPPVPPASRTPKGHKGYEEAHPHAVEVPVVEDRKHHNADEQGQTANIKQNTTNAGFFRGRRMK